MREHVRNLKIIQLHVAQNWRRKALNLGFVIITFRTRSENALLSNGGRRIMFVWLSEIHRKNAHSTTPRKKKHRNNPKLQLVLPTVARVIKSLVIFQIPKLITIKTSLLLIRSLFSLLNLFRLGLMFIFIDKMYLKSFFFIRSLFLTANVK